MTRQVTTPPIENLGYQLLPKPHPHSPGHTGLVVTMQQTPTRLHFDPEAMHLRLCERGLANRVTLKLNSTLAGPQGVCPGRVSLWDRLDKRVDFFIFGGQLEATYEPSKTIYILSSSAPLLALTSGLESIPDQLAAEVELMLGVLQVRWNTDEKGFAQRLAQIEPFQFYLASLGSIFMRYQRAQALKETYYAFYQALLREKAWLTETGQWPTTPLQLGTLLAAPDHQVKA